MGKSIYIGRLVFSLVFVLLTMSMFYYNGCAPTVQQTQINPERQKAIEDSLQKVYIYSLNKAWSTGYEYYKPKIYRRAVNPFWQVIKLDTIDRFKDVYSLLSDCYFKLGVPDSAQIVLELGLEKYPDNVGLRRNYAYLLAGKEQIEQAIPQYEKVTEADGAQANDWKQLANLYLRVNEMDKAIAAYQKIMAIDPTDQEAQQTLGQLLKGSGDEDAAIEALEKALQLDPENTQVMFDLGKFYYNRGEYDKAVNKFQSYLAKKPDDFVAMEYLGGSLYGKGDYRQSVTVYQQILTAKPDNKKIYTDVATDYKELGDFITARKYVQKALAVDTDYGLAYIVLGEIYEAAVDQCMKQTGKRTPKFDDKLVFLEAYRQYQRATKDYQFKDMAERRMSQLKDFLPSKEDEFFNKNRKLDNGRYKIVEKCYEWIAPSL